MRKIKDFILWLLGISQVPRNFVFCLLHGLRLDPTWRFYGLPWIRKGGHGSSIKIGRNFTAVSSNAHNSFGIIQRAYVATVGHGARVEIGDNVGISGCTISAGKSIRIGNNVLIGSGAVITDGDAHPVDPEERRAGAICERRPVVIEDDVFIGARAIILKGVTVGRGSVVGAAAVVARDVHQYSVFVGNQAQVVGDSRKC